MNRCGCSFTEVPSSFAEACRPENWGGLGEAGLLTLALGCIVLLRRLKR